MQTLFRILLAVSLAHLLTDFVFQSHRMVARKRSGELAPYLIHGLIHYLASIGVLSFFVKGSILSPLTHVVLLVLSLVHLVIDFLKVRLTERRVLHDGSFTYVFDQLLHFLTIFAAALLLSPSSALREFPVVVDVIRAAPTRFIAVPVVYILVVFGGGYFIRFVTRSLAEGLKTGSPEKSSEQLQNAGLYIGWLERFLVLTALLLQSPVTVGLMLTAKSIARYPEFRSERFAEYFLIGTLLSVSVALIGGALLSKLLFGHLRLSG